MPTLGRAEQNNFWQNLTRWEEQNAGNLYDGRRCLLFIAGTDLSSEIKDILKISEDTYPSGTFHNHTMYYIGDGADFQNKCYENFIGVTDVSRVPSGLPGRAAVKIKLEKYNPSDGRCAFLSKLNVWIQGQSGSDLDVFHGPICTVPGNGSAYKNLSRFLQWLFMLRRDNPEFPMFLVMYGNGQVHSEGGYSETQRMIIDIFSSPTSSGYLERTSMGDDKYKTMYKYVPTNRDMMITPAHIGRDIITPEGLHLASFVRDRILYIYYDFIYRTSKHDADLMIMQNIITQAIKNIGTRMEFTDAQREAFVDGLGAVPRDRLAQLDNEIGSNQAIIESLQSELRDAFEVRTNIYEERKSFEGTAEGFKQKCYKQWEQIIQNPYVSNVFVSDNQMVVTTNKLHALDDRTMLTHYMGKAEIKIQLSSLAARRQQNVKITQIDNLICNYPNSSMWFGHVTKNGNICFGSQAVPIHETLGEYDFVGTLGLVLQFLMSANTNDDYGRHISEFPVVWAHNKKLVECLANNDYRIRNDDIRTLMAWKKIHPFGYNTEDFKVWKETGEFKEKTTATVRYLERTLGINVSSSLTTIPFIEEAKCQEVAS